MFPTETEGLEEARVAEVAVAGGGGVELGIAPAASRTGGDTVRMLAYNGSMMFSLDVVAA